MVFKRVSAILCSIFFIAITVACKQPKEEIMKIGGYQGTVNGVRFSLTDLGEEVNLHSELQNDYFEKFPQKGADYAMKCADGMQERGHPVPVCFTWLAETQKEVTKYTLRISEKRDMTSAYLVESAFCEAYVYNLKIATVYYWDVTVHTGSEEIRSGVACFKTETNAPRNLYVDGVTNVRDLGGYQVGGNKRMKQGFIYRCGRLNVSLALSPQNEITDAGIQTMREQLGIKTEVDLREAENGETGKIVQSPLGADVRYINIPMIWDGNLLEINIEAVAKVFSVLAQKENYPLIFHCNLGTDRAGLIAFLVGAICGMSIEDLTTDYAWSNFGKIGGQRSCVTIMQDYLPLIYEASGENLQECTYNYLAQKGVSAKDMDAIIKNFI